LISKQAFFREKSENLFINSIYSKSSNLIQNKSRFRPFLSSSGINEMVNGKNEQEFVKTEQKTKK
jgi:hypothetical protein